MNTRVLRFARSSFQRCSIMTNNNVQPKQCVRSLHNQMQHAKGEEIRSVTDMSQQGLKLSDIKDAVASMLFSKPQPIEKTDLGRFGVDSEKSANMSRYDHCAGEEMKESKP